MEAGDAADTPTNVVRFFDPRRRDRNRLTVGAYVARWLKGAYLSRKPTTGRRYEQICRTYIIPALGDHRLAHLRRADVQVMLSQLMERGRASATIRTVLAVTQAMLRDAVDDELIAGNPASGLSRRLRLNPSMRAKGEAVNACTVEELAAFLRRIWLDKPQLATLFEVYARAGLRLGEGLALRWEDLQPDGLRIQRSWTENLIMKPKAGHARTVEIGPRLRDVLAQLPRTDEWLFTNTYPGKTLPLWNATYVGRVCNRVGARIGIAGLHPHTLRHSYASILIAAGEPTEWVSRQLGHARSDFTTTIYGRWLKMRNPRGLVRLDELLDGKVPADGLVPGGRVE